MDAEKVLISSMASESKAFAKRYNLIKHTERVVKMCKKFAEKFPEDVDPDLLIDSAWLHDIAKFQLGDKHNKRKKVRKVIENLVPHFEEERLDNIAEIISVHTGEFNPRSHVLESAILRICDKLDKFEKMQDDAEEKCRKSMEKIEGKLNSRDYEILNELYQDELGKWV